MLRPPSSPPQGGQGIWAENPPRSSNPEPGRLARSSCETASEGKSELLEVPQVLKVPLKKASIRCNWTGDSVFVGGVCDRAFFMPVSQNISDT